MAALTERETQQIEQANASGRTPVVALDFVKRFT